MRDLYRKLELDPTATKEDIAAAIEKHPELQDYAAILLDDEKRPLYDQVHHTLKLIGTLRFRLDLDKNDASFIRQYSDFAIMPKPVFTGTARDAGGDQSPESGRDKKGRGPKWWLAALVVALIAAAAIVLLLTVY